MYCDKEILYLIITTYHIADAVCHDDFEKSVLLDASHRCVSTRAFRAALFICYTTLGNIQYC